MCIRSSCIVYDHDRMYNIPAADPVMPSPSPPPAGGGWVMGVVWAGVGVWDGIAVCVCACTLKNFISRYTY